MKIVAWGLVLSAASTLAASTLTGCSKHDAEQDKLDRAIERAGGIERDSTGRVIDTHATPGSPGNPYADPSSGDYRAATNPGGIDTRPGVPAGTPAPGAPEKEQLTAEEAKAGCAKKVASACGQLAVYYTLGLDVPEDRKKAEKLARPGCDAGDALSCYALGGLLETDLKPGDEAKALELYDRACTRGASEGCAELGAVYMSGRTSRGTDGAKAVEYLRKACALGDRTACLQVPMIQACVDQPQSSDPICQRMQKH